MTQFQLISPFLLIYEINYWVFIQFYFTCNNFYIIFLYNSILHAIISTLLIIFARSLIHLFCCIKRNIEIYNNVVPQLVCRFNRLQSFNYTPYLFYKKIETRDKFFLYVDQAARILSLSLSLTFYLSSWRYWTTHSPGPTVCTIYESTTYIFAQVLRQNRHTVFLPQLLTKTLGTNLNYEWRITDAR